MLIRICNRLKFVSFQLTSVGAKAILLVDIEIFSGGAPAVTIITTFGGAAIVGLAKEHKRKLARFPITVPANRIQIWRNKMMSPSHSQSINPEPAKVTVSGWQNPQELHSAEC